MSISTLIKIEEGIFEHFHGTGPTLALIFAHLYRKRLEIEHVGRVS